MSCCLDRQIDAGLDMAAGLNMVTRQRIRDGMATMQWICDGMATTQLLLNGRASRREQSLCKSSLGDMAFFAQSYGILDGRNPFSFDSCAYITYVE